MNITLYYSDCCGDKNNCLYPHKVAIDSKEAFEEAVKHDYVCAEYKDNYRSNANFIRADCLAMDCDNTHTDDPSAWITPYEVAEAFDGVTFAVHYSRNNEKEKDGRAARPRFHVFFLIDPITSSEEYSRLKQRVQAAFPQFDSGALDAGRFFFGTKEPKVEFYPGTLTLNAFLEESEDFDVAMACGTYGDQQPIPEGQRHTTLTRRAAQIVKRYGDSEEAKEAFMSVAELCDPPLDDREVQSIWESARKLEKKMSSQPGYIPPELFNQKIELKPEDYSDVDQAVVLAREYGDTLRYSVATDFIVYTGVCWEESKPKAQGIAQELTTRQRKEAKAEVQKIVTMIGQQGLSKILLKKNAKRESEIQKLPPDQQRLFRDLEKVTAYLDFIRIRRNSRFIESALKETIPTLDIDYRTLDANEFLLNTPSATYDLRTGEKREHRAEDLITKQTTVDPDDKGIDIWLKATDVFFQGDTELQAYVQDVVGLSLIGKVYLEALIIAYGEGRNGKSTFWNTISRVLGTYSGNISADTLTSNCKRNVKPELAEARGKRLLIAAELEETMSLSTSVVKQLCSTDVIYAEKKYKAPFSYTPTHTLVLYTNYLPKVSALDEGTWRRLIVIPFNAVIEGDKDIKNYADYLYENCGSAVLSWAMQGARHVIENGFKVKKPQAVEEASKKYRNDNNWIAGFIAECCDVGENYEASASELRTAYKKRCEETGERYHDTRDFAAALEKLGFERRHSMKGAMYKGIRLTIREFKEEQ